eukprot:scaffold59617_cov79-Phaeocystis_antarctica.AAC.20
MVQPPEPDRDQGGVVGGGGRCHPPQGRGDGHAPQHAHRVPVLVGPQLAMPKAGHRGSAAL